MLEAKLNQAGLLKKILEAVKDLVTDANFDCSPSGIALQAMDSSHVSLVSLMLNAEGFEHYRCDRGLQLGINLGSMSKILKCAGNDDAVTLKSEDAGSVVSFTFESQSTCFRALCSLCCCIALPLFAACSSQSRTRSPSSTSSSSRSSLTFWAFPTLSMPLP